MELEQIRAALKKTGYGSRPDLLDAWAKWLYQEYSNESTELKDGVPLRDIVFQDITRRVKNA